MDDSLSSSDDNNISDDSLAVIEAVIVPYLDTKHLGVSPDLSKDTTATPASAADSILRGETAASAGTAIGLEEIYFNSGPNLSCVSPCLLAGVSFNQPTPSLPSSLSTPRPKSEGPSQTSQQAAAPTPMATLVMASRGPDGGKRQQKMMIKCEVQVIKVMKMFGLDFRKLRFFVDGNELTGEEKAGELDGAKIWVEEL